MTIETNAIAPVAPVVSLAEVVELRSINDDTGKLNLTKKAWMTHAKEAGISRSDAEAEFESACKWANSIRKANASALVSSDRFEVAGIRHTKTGYSLRLVRSDAEAKATKEAEKTAKRIAALEAKLASLKAKA